MFCWHTATPFVSILSVDTSVSQWKSRVVVTETEDSWNISRLAHHRKWLLTFVLRNWSGSAEIGLLGLGVWQTWTILLCIENLVWARSSGFSIHSFPHSFIQPFTIHPRPEPTLPSRCGWGGVTGAGAQISAGDSATRTWEKARVWGQCKCKVETSLQAKFHNSGDGCTARATPIWREAPSSTHPSLTCRDSNWEAHAKFMSHNLHVSEFPTSSAISCLVPHTVLYQSPPRWPLGMKLAGQMCTRVR